MLRSFLAFAALFCAFAAPAHGQASSKPAPKLIVMISIDQFSANLYEEWRGKFTGGLKQLSTGVVFPSAYQTHSITETCPGHSTLLTGKHPNKTGIIANDWYDPARGAVVYCLFAPGNTLAHDPKASPVGPDNIAATSLGDWLKARAPQSRVFAVSGKDRAAINLAGHNPDGAYWYVDKVGFTTYVKPGEDGAAKLKPIAALNAQVLERMRRRPPTWTYENAACRALEGDYDFEGKSVHFGLPQPVTPLPLPPVQDAITLEAASMLVKTQRLGRGPSVDLLGVGLSGTDYVGHAFGARGAEMCDHLSRLDKRIGDFLKTLDGIDVLVVVSADHGGSDFPERLAQSGYPAKRIDSVKWLEPINDKLKAQFGLSYAPLKPAGFDVGQLWVVDAAGHAAPEPLRARVLAAALPLIRANGDVGAAYSSAELEQMPAPTAPADELTLAQRMAMSVYPGRSADIQLVFKPYITPSPPTFGRYVGGHGSPYTYDRRVPILFWWRGAGAQERILPVETTDIAPTLANILGLAAPADMDGRCLVIGEWTCPR